MISRFKLQNSNFRAPFPFFKASGTKLFLILISGFALFLSAACGVPVLEKPECLEAKQTVKEFYSFHFGNEMKFSAENLRPREKFLTGDFVKLLQNAPPDNDVFTTNSTDFPKAFRIGGCEVTAADKAVFEVLLFWKDDKRTEQRAIGVEAIKQNGEWLINKINY
ncbi:MAG: hypothetical protein JWN60_1010 [Acidobacteria bacterium]|jgi:hypothetical protein|nr:hypothetical protein [Acidobacteriota bacterium]